MSSDELIVDRRLRGGQLHRLRLWRESDTVRRYCDQWDNEWLLHKERTHEGIVFGRCKCGEDLTGHGYEYDSNATKMRSMRQVD